MSFSFDAALSSDVDLVRFNIGDTDPNGHYIENETIQYFVDHGSVGEAVLASIKYIITQLSKPDFRLDWMSVSNMADARKGFEDLLINKAAEFGVSPNGITATSTISQPYRADSLQNSDKAVYDGTTL